jgi:hypothetical protein
MEIEKKKLIWNKTNFKCVGNIDNVLVNLEQRQCMYKRNIETRSLNHCFRAKSVSVTYFEYVSVSLVIQHVKRKSLIILKTVGSVAVP